MGKLKESRLFFWSIELLTLATLLYVCTKIGFLFQPFGILISTLFAPILVAGFLYYMMNPLVHLLERFKIKRSLAIILIFIVLIVLLSFLVVTIIPSLIDQVSQFAQNFPSMLKEGQNQLDLLAKRPELQNLDMQKYINDLNLSTSKLVTGVVNGFTSSVFSIIGVISSVTLVIVTVPIVLFYMFKDGDKLPNAIVRFVPKSYKQRVLDLISDVNSTLASFISGQALVCLYVGTCAFIGYLVIGMPYALLLGVIAGVMDIIPYLGPWLGVAPAILIALTRSPLEALLVAVIIIVIQIGESNLVYPLVMGKSLDMHPLTIIFILLVAGNLAGLVGMIIGIPAYAVIKIILHHLYRAVDDKKGIPQLNRSEIEEI